MTGLVLLAAGLVAAVAAVRVARLTPRTERSWATDHAVPARITFEDGQVRVDRLRDFEHTGPDGVVERYRDEVFDTADVRRVWFVLAPFVQRWRGLAHSFVSFELTEGRYVSVSVEARREVDETFSLLRGVMRGFEITYVVGTERDLIGLRAVRGDSLYLYPSRATPTQARAIFVDMLTRAEAVRTRPEFYNTLTNSCSSNLRAHVNRVITDPLPWGWGVVFPGYSDELALSHGLLDTDLEIELARERFRIDPQARAALAARGDSAPAGDAFGRRIRAGLGASEGGSDYDR